MDKITDAVIEWAKEYFEKIIDTNILRRKLRKYLKRQKLNFNTFTKEEEFDFDGLSEYILCSDFLVEVLLYYTEYGIEHPSFKSNIYSKALLYAKVASTSANNIVTHMINDAKDIIKNYYFSKVPRQDRFLATIAIKSTADKISLSEQRILKEINKLDPKLSQKDNTLTELPHQLSLLSAVHADQQSVLHRQGDIFKICRVIQQGKHSILLNGFGGIGKTSVARVLYTKLESDYDCIGWVEYHKNLQTSILNSFELFKEVTDPALRWKLIKDAISINPQKKIIFIDNVDRDISQSQDPSTDDLLQEIVRWNNSLIILTSRLQEIPGYYSYMIPPLGTSKRIQPCIDLFYFYYNMSEYKKHKAERVQTNAVIKLIELAGFHTYAIELLAKSARFESDLNEYYLKIKSVGFSFPKLNIRTGYSNSSKPAAEQLKLLFKLGNRSSKEQQILWDFSTLPEGTRLTSVDVSSLLGYDMNDLATLCDDGWLRFEYPDGFYIHPLIREIILFDLIDGKAPIGTVSELVKKVINYSIISNEDSQINILRKLYIIETVEKYIVFVKSTDFAKFYYQLGKAEYSFARKRLSAIEYYKRALRKYTELYNLGLDYLYDIADTQFQIGYVESTTQIYRNDSKEYLRLALDNWKSCKNCTDEISLAQDHLGYVLTDSPETYSDAEYYLSDALNTRAEKYKTTPTEEAKYEYSTTCDNMGYLLFKSGKNIIEAKHLLMKSFKLREELNASYPGKYSTDVAWTAFNLGELISDTGGDDAEAEAYFRISLQLRKSLEKLYPRKYSINIMYTITSLAKLIARDSTRISEVQNLFDEAMTYYGLIDEDHASFFINNIESDMIFLSGLLKSN